MDKRLALRMTFLLTAALLGGFLFVLQVGELEDRQLRRELKALAETLAALINPEPFLAPRSIDDPGRKSVQAELDVVRKVYGDCRRIEILERRGDQISRLASSDDEGGPAVDHDERAAEPFFDANTSIVLDPEAESDGLVISRAFAPLKRADGKPGPMIAVEMIGAGGFDGLSRAQRLAGLAVGLGLLGIVLVWRQLHREARIAEAIRVSEEWFRGISQAALNPIVVIDDRGEITYWNDAAERTLGYSRQEVAGVELRRLLSPPELFDDYRRGLPASERSDDGGVRGDTIELAALRKGGERVPIELCVSTFRLGRRWHTVGVMSDLSARKRLIETLDAARAAAERANRAKSEFLANMSHEIRTPMNGVIGMTELLLDTELTPRQRDFVETVDDSAESLLAVINDILDFSKVEAGKLTLDPIPFALRDLVEGTMRTLAVRAHARGLELACRLGPDVPDGVLGDSKRLRQVLVNLVGNAIKFTSEGEVVVTVDRVSEGEPGGPDDLRFTVRDTGVGIPLDKHKAVFEPFEQADSSTTRRYGGTGLGLPIADRLVQLMGGRIEIDSRPGLGSTFRFTIPLVGSSAVSEPIPRERVKRLAGRSVLVVDDHETNRRIIVELLAGWRIEATAAADAQSALEAMRRAARAGAPFDLALLDHMMPGTDGLELATAIRADARLRSTPLLMTTSSGDGGLESRAEDLGISRILHKPIRRVDLCRSLLALLAPADDGSGDGERRTDEPTGARDRLRVLLVEDNPVNQKVASAMLEQLGHRVTIADDGRAGVEAYLAGSFDLVLMDIQMPEMDGFEALASIRDVDDGRGGRTPVVALTAHSMPRDQERCLEAGFDGYLSKPIRRDELEALATSLGGMNMKGGRPAAPPKPAFDLAFALAQAGGDASVLAQLADLFRIHAPTQLGAVRDALRVGDATAVARAAHTLKGSTSVFLIRDRLDALHDVERLGKQGRLADALARLPVVEALIADLTAALDQMSGCELVASASG
ncbi:MAG: response regulator [Paludisphaera borealis]|uniref:hybrid sensor histidine kinase/response regulator n=1 Tax=Paludisphaera borealis TaxID=1387353 RepID=UPI00283B0621|nr:response regulator [Paludisphaera borealis]MDR3620583.1 response regulator [Paludisphaera borealis]